MERHAVVQHRGRAVEQYGGDQRRTRLPALLGEHGIEAADGVCLQAKHGTAAIEKKDELRQLLFHIEPS